VWAPASAIAHIRRGYAQTALCQPSQAMYSFAHGLLSQPAHAVALRELVRAQSAVGTSRHFHVTARRPPANYPEWEAPVKPTMPSLPPAVEKEAPARPASPKEKQRLEVDDSWRQIDIADIMEEQARMKHTIEEALLDGRIDEEEVEAIGWQLQRSGLPKKQKERVREAILANCESGEPLSEEDMALLKAITPPAPQDDWKEIIKTMDEEVGFLKTIFRFFCLEGKTGNADVETMGMSQFSKFCKACNIVDKNLKVSDCDRIFLRANQDRLGDMVDVLSKNMTKKQKAQKAKMKKAGPDHELDVTEFVAATIRCAHLKYRQLPAIADRYAKLLTECIKANSVFELEDDLSAAVESPQLSGPEGVMILAEGKLRRLFEKWCAADATAFTAAENSTMNLPEWMMFLKACNLVGPVRSRHYFVSWVVSVCGFG
jgi:hypothetical protein